MKNVLIYILILNFLINEISTWENEDLALFDLIEEVNQNFYELLKIDQSSSQQDIKRSYRKLSLQLHPDRNKQEDADVKFRQLVSVYEVLKDEQLRIKYNDVLINGLPDWRQPVYYYRRIRKLGLLEISLALVLLITTGHFITMWAIYLEKKFELEELFNSKRKKEKKLRKSKVDCNDDENMEQIILEELGEKPRLRDLLPFLMITSFSTFIRSLPSNARLKYEEYRLQKQMAIEDAEEEEEKSGKQPDKERSKRQKYSFINDLPTLNPNETDLEKSNCQIIGVDTGSFQCSKEGEWSEDDIDLLVKGVVRFPGGTPERWEKISQLVGRRVKEVIKMANELKTSNPVKNKKSFPQLSESQIIKDIPSKAPTTSPEIVDIKESNSETILNDLSNRSNNNKANTGSTEISSNSSNSVASKSNTNIELSGILKAKQSTTQNTSIKEIRDRNIDDIQNNAVSKNGLLVEVGGKDAVDTWNRQQQKQLELALIQISKDWDNRWDAIAELVPGKNKEECKLRYKYLSEIVKRKKQLQKL